MAIWKLIIIGEMEEDIIPIIQWRQKVFISSPAGLILKGKVKWRIWKTELCSHIFSLPSHVNLKALYELATPKTTNSRNWNNLKLDVNGESLWGCSKMFFCVIK